MMVKGKLELITGPMFSGKTEELMRKIRRLRIAKKVVSVFKPIIDTRYDKNSLASHNGQKLEAICITTASEILLCRDLNANSVAIEEAQFFGSDILEVVNYLLDQGVDVICAGLSRDFSGRPFGSMPTLLVMAEEITSLSAVCTVCGDDAYFTQRIIDGKPAKKTDPIILVGATENYEARCRTHHEVPD